MERPSLVVVGTGIRVLGQMTTEAAAWIKVADKVLYLAHDPLAGEIISELNPRAESLAGCYADGKLRRQSYREMVGRVMECVRSGKFTCLAFYGHPGVYCLPGHEAIRQARLEGFTARMLPAVSAEDCLFADLGLDPGTHGCQSYEATDFLKNSRGVDPSSLLILWQVGTLGDPSFHAQGGDLTALPLLIDRLCRDYHPDHEVIVYAAPIHWGGEAVVERVPLRSLAGARISASSTLCLLPGQAARPDKAVYERLGLPLQEPGKEIDAPRTRRKARSRRSPPGVPKPVQAFQPRRAR